MPDSVFPEPPPFIADLASRYGVQVFIRSLGGPDAYALDRQIHLEESLYPPRMNFLFCHELAHILLGHTRTGPVERAHEREAAELAMELLLPRDQFRRDMAAMSFLELRRSRPHASWEAVASRWCELRPAVLTIYDNERLTRRWAPDALAYPRRPTQEEAEVARCCYTTQSPQSQSTTDLRIQGFYVDEGRGVLRVILLTEVISWV